MDLKDLAPKTGDIVVTLKHPATDEPLLNEDKSPMTITLYSPHSKEYKKFQHEQITKRLQKAQKDGTGVVDYGEIEEATLEVLAKTTKTWDITYGGEKPKLTVTKAKELYDEVFWIKSQVEDEGAKTLDFMKA